MSLRSYVLRPRPVRLATWLIAVGVISAALGLWADGVRRRRLRDALRQPLISAAEMGDTAMVRRLLDQGADVDSVVNGRFPWTPLMHAAFRGNTETARLLIERGADLDHIDLDYFSAVTLAASEGHWEIVRALVARGALLDQADAYGKFPLDYAREAGNAEMVRLLEAARPASDPD